MILSNRSEARDALTVVGLAVCVEEEGDVLSCDLKVIHDYILTRRRLYLLLSAVSRPLISTNGSSGHCKTKVDALTMPPAVPRQLREHEP
jgi:hypothetical protein